MTQRLVYLVPNTRGPESGPMPFSVLVLHFDSALQALLFALAVMGMQQGADSDAA